MDIGGTELTGVTLSFEDHVWLEATYLELKRNLIRQGKILSREEFWSKPAFIVAVPPWMIAHMRHSRLPHMPVQLQPSASPARIKLASS